MNKGYGYQLCLLKLFCLIFWKDGAPGNFYILAIIITQQNYYYYFEKSF